MGEKKKAAPLIGKKTNILTMACGKQAAAATECGGPWWAVFQFGGPSLRGAAGMATQCAGPFAPSSHGPYWAPLSLAFSISSSIRASSARPYGIQGAWLAANGFSKSSSHDTIPWKCYSSLCV
jgi:hypothetical protein